MSMARFDYSKSSMILALHFLGGSWVSFLARMAFTIVASQYLGSYVAIILTQIALAFAIIGAVLLIFGMLWIFVNARKKADVEPSNRGNKLVLVLIIFTFLITVITNVVASVVFP